jgi:hypothetical protein
MGPKYESFDAVLADCSRSAEYRATIESVLDRCAQHFVWSSVLFGHMLSCRRMVNASSGTARHGAGRRLDFFGS